MQLCKGIRLLLKVHWGCMEIIGITKTKRGLLKLQLELNGNHQQHRHKGIACSSCNFFRNYSSTNTNIDEFIFSDICMLRNHGTNLQMLARRYQLTNFYVMCLCLQSVSFYSYHIAASDSGEFWLRITFSCFIQAP